MIEVASTGPNRSRSPYKLHMHLHLHLLWLLLAAGVLVLILWVGVLLAGLPYYGLDTFDDAIHSQQGATVVRVAPEGPADQAGVQKGDYLTVPDRDDVAYSPPSPFLSSAQMEAPLVVLLARDSTESRIATISPAPVPFSVLVARLEAPAIAFVFWAVSLVLFLLRPPYPASRTFFTLGQLIALMLVAGSAGAAYYPGGGLFFRLFLILVAAVAFHFCAIFPSPLPDRPLKRMLTVVYALASLITVLSVILPTFLVDMIPAAVLTTSYRLYVLVVLLSALVLLIRTRYKTSYLALYKQRLLITGMIVSFLPVLSLSFLPEIVTGAPLFDYVWTFPALVLLPVAYAYAVRQQALSLVDLLVNRSLVYGILTILLLASYFALAYLLGWLIPAEDWSLPLTSGLLSVASVLLHNRVRTRLQRWLDRIFFGGWYDYHSVTRAASATLSQASSLHQLLTRLTSITQSMRFQSAELYLPEGGSLVPKVRPGQLEHSATVTPPLPSLPASGQLALHLLVQNRPLKCADIKLALARKGAILTEGEQTLLNTLGLDYLLPLVSRGELRGALALGMRQADMVLSAEDVEIMMLLAAQAAVAAENVGLVEALQARLAEMERMRSDLGEAQRRLAENQEVSRIRLAQELHDGAVQQLLGISYQLVRAQGQGQEENRLVEANANSKGSTNGSARPSRTLEEMAGVGAEENDTQGYALSSAPGIDLDAIRHEMLSVVTQLRGLIGELRPPGLDEFGFVTAIEGFVSRLYRDAQKIGRPMPAIYMDLPPECVDLSRPIALCLFRTTQEAVRNSLKHAHASSIHIELKLTQCEALLCISDDGDGFDVPDSFSKLTQNEHYGLVGIAERVDWVNGTFKLESTPGEGTELRVTLPLPDQG